MAESGIEKVHQGIGNADGSVWFDFGGGEQGVSKGRFTRHQEEGKQRKRKYPR